MRAHSRAYWRVFSLLITSTLGAAAVGLAGTPALAATGGPTGLTTAGQACDTTAPGPYLSPERLNDAQAVVLDGAYDTGAWGAAPTADFQVWDVRTPDQPQDWSDHAGASDGHVSVQLEDPARQLDGVTYGWKVRVVTGSGASPWSDTCYYTVDRAGGPAPAVASTDYPPGDWGNASGEIGTPGSFTFTSASADTVSYRYTFYDGAGEQSVAADRLGGPATIRWTPKDAGSTTVTVYAIDRAGNYSDRQDYTFWVLDTRPSVFSAAYQDSAGYGDLKYNVGVPGDFDFTANIANTASFAWHIDQDGPSGSTDADADGKASVMIAPVKAGHQTLYVSSVTRDGVHHPERAYPFYVDNAPKATGDLDRSVPIGSTIHFHLEPRTSDVTAYVYWVVHRYSDTVVKETLPAGADGVADLAWTADNANEDLVGINVQARSADGTLSEPRWLSDTVSGASPWITRTGGDVVGSTATITASTEMADPTEYEAVLNNDPSTKQVVPAAADGSATFKFTVTQAQYTQVTVIARNAAGVHTDPGSTSWAVTDGPAITSTDFPNRGFGHMTAGTFSFKAQQPGATKFLYTIQGTGIYNKEVPVGADGTATVTWTPQTPGNYLMYVTSQTASGTSSVQTYYNFTIQADPVTVTAVSPATVQKGGVRTLTITGSGFNPANYVTVWTSNGSYFDGTVTGVSADHTTLTATVDLTSAATGPASVTVQPDGYSDAATLANAFTVVDQPALTMLTAPVITGTAAVGATLKSSTGAWNPKAATYTYQWSAGGTPISGAVGANYVIKAADLGKRISVSVTATRSGYLAATTASATTAAVGKGPAPKATVLPKITGTAKPGGTLHASTGTWKPAATSYRYEWRAAGKLLTTTTASLKVTTAMRGEKVTVTVVALEPGHTDGRATSAAVTVLK